jgi:hypothetical protein
LRAPHDRGDQINTKAVRTTTTFFGEITRASIEISLSTVLSAPKKRGSIVIYPSPAAYKKRRRETGERGDEEREKHPEAEFSAGGTQLSSINTYTYSSHNQNPSTNLHTSTHTHRSGARRKDMELLPVVPNGENDG